MYKKCHYTQTASIHFSDANINYERILKQPQAEHKNQVLNFKHKKPSDLYQTQRTKNEKSREIQQILNSKRLQAKNNFQATSHLLELYKRLIHKESQLFKETYITFHYEFKLFLQTKMFPNKNGGVKKYTNGRSEDRASLSKVIDRAFTSAFIVSVV